MRGGRLRWVLLERRIPPPGQFVLRIQSRGRRGRDELRTIECPEPRWTQTAEERRALPDRIKWFVDAYDVTGTSAGQGWAKAWRPRPLRADARLAGRVRSCRDGAIPSLCPPHRPSTARWRSRRVPVGRRESIEAIRQLRNGSPSGTRAATARRGPRPDRVLASATALSALAPRDVGRSRAAGLPRLHRESLGESPHPDPDLCFALRRAGSLEAAPPEAKIPAAEQPRVSRARWSAPRRSTPADRRDYFGCQLRTRVYRQRPRGRASANRWTCSREALERFRGMHERGPGYSRPSETSAGERGTGARPGRVSWSGSGPGARATG